MLSCASPGSPVFRSLRALRRSAPILAGIAAAILAAVPARAAGRLPVALLPVVVHSSEDPLYLQQGLGDMLVTRLARDPRIAVIPVEDASAATTDAEAARDSGRAAGADYVVYGSFTRFGQGASLDLFCTSTHAEGKARPREIFTQSADLAAIIPMLDGVAEKLAAYLVEGAPAGTAVSAAPSDSGPDEAPSSEVVELRRRVEALERTVYATRAIPKEADRVPGAGLGQAPGGPDR